MNLILFLRIDIVLNCRRKKDIQCVSVQKCNDETYSSKLRYHMELLVIFISMVYIRKKIIAISHFLIVVRLTINFTWKNC